VAAQRAWMALVQVYGFGPHALCDLCEQPLETLGSLNTGRCSRCVLLHGAGQGGVLPQCNLEDPA